MINPRITILMPHKGHCAYISDAVKSIICQDYDNWELVILNDDKKKLSDFELIDNRIKVYDFDDNQSSEKRVNSYRSFGDYIILHDADIISMPYRFKTIVSIIKKKKIDIVMSDGYCIYPNNKRIYLNNDCFNFIPSLFFKSTLLETIKFPESIKYGSDIIWWNNVMNAGYKVYHVNIPLFCKWANSSITKKFNNIFILGKLWRLLNTYKLKRRIKNDSIRNKT